MKTITKKDLVQKIARDKNLDPKNVQLIVQGLLDGITEFLSHGDRLEFRGFAIFEPVIRKQKVGRNPKKPEVPIIIPEKKAIKFVPSKKMKELIAEI